jgi:hypothetical protein
MPFFATASFPCHVLVAIWAVVGLPTDFVRRFAPCSEEFLLAPGTALHCGPSRAAPIYGGLPISFAMRTRL